MKDHGERLDIHFAESVSIDSSELPLFLDMSGNALTNAEVSEAIRMVLKEADIELFKTNSDGKDVQSFNIH